MSLPVGIRSIMSIVALTAAWCGLWGSFSAANLLGGLAVAVVVTASGVGTAGAGGVRFVPLVRLIWLVLVDLTISTYKVAFEVLTPTDRTEESIIAVATPVETRGHLLLLVVAITLTPGTAVVDADIDAETNTCTLYLHLLHHDRQDTTAVQVQKLAQLACDALPLTARKAAQ